MVCLLLSCSLLPAPSLALVWLCWTSQTTKFCTLQEPDALLLLPVNSAACRKLDDTEFRNPFDRAYVRLYDDSDRRGGRGGGGGGYRSRSRSRWVGCQAGRHGVGQRQEFWWRAV